MAPAVSPARAASRPSSRKNVARYQGNAPEASGPSSHGPECQRQIPLRLRQPGHHQVCRLRIHQEVGPRREVGLLELGARVGRVPRGRPAGVEQRGAERRVLHEGDGAGAVEPGERRLPQAGERGVGRAVVAVGRPPGGHGAHILELVPAGLPARQPRRSGAARADPRLRQRRWCPVPNRAHRRSGHGDRRSRCRWCAGAGRPRPAGRR